MRTIAINLPCNRCIGPEGSTRRLHHIFNLWGRLRLDMHSKDGTFARLDTTVRVHNLDANDNFAAERVESAAA